MHKPREVTTKQLNGLIVLIGHCCFSSAFHELQPSQGEPRCWPICTHIKSHPADKRSRTMLISCRLPTTNRPNQVQASIEPNEAFCWLNWPPEYVFGMSSWQSLSANQSATFGCPQFGLKCIFDVVKVLQWFSMKICSGADPRICSPPQTCSRFEKACFRFGVRRERKL